LSYVRKFEPWDWIIGTGIYIEDVKAEEELLKSRELYRTLAEAASEGVMIWSGKSIQANKTVLSWLEYPEAVYEELSAQRTMECVLRKKNGKLIKSLASFSSILLGGMKAVLIVVRPSEGMVTQPGFLLQPSLLQDITTGFFRITYGRKNVFISASEPVLKALGYASLQDLAPHIVESLFIEPGQFRAFRLALESGKNIFNREVLLRRKNGDEFRALVSVMIVRADTGDIWCEGTIEPLTAGLYRNNPPMADLNEYSASYIMQAPVSLISVPAVECRENMTASRTVTVMKENNTSVAVVSGMEGKPLGISGSKTGKPPLQ